MQPASTPARYRDSVITGGAGRFIPARAGNTSPPARSRRPVRVHPRSRGEHWRVGRDRNSRTGSSPLARGTQARTPPPLALLQFIPARAGNTETSSFATGSIPVHPRSRGEHMSARRIRAPAAGSSPLARGTHLARPGARGLHRFIPARAGNTSSASRMRPSSPVHPRSRGEHCSSGPGCHPSTGSSPLARGTRRPAEIRGRRHRFIPARAGNTCAPPPCPRPRSVHPRSRGEHHPTPDGSVSNVGSSPLARGTHHVPSREREQRRFIPARAGNTTV